MIIRQGDILFTQIAAIPTGAEQVPDGIIARGETTGHAHRLRAQKGNALMLAAGIMYLRALQQAHVDHEEHNTVVLPTGDWQIGRQREYVSDGWRQVQD